MSIEPSTPTMKPSDQTRRPWKRWISTGFVAFVFVYLGFFGYFYSAMRRPPEAFGRVMMHAGPVPFLLFPFETMWTHARAGTLIPGSEAPDFELPRLDGSGVVRLSAFKGIRPVVLIFGSYT